ncbi:hypothetical protein ACFX5Q_10200 [Mesorhizobium sp. IMUNJ 23033]|uniref:hypothetical protein n=1 Tax=Mesorhizobium sp. IMUNJ 23033 TaxID=3378039 RepID=UPI0038507C28
MEKKRVNEKPDGSGGRMRRSMADKQAAEQLKKLQPDVSPSAATFCRNRYCHASAGFPSRIDALCSG